MALRLAWLCGLVGLAWLSAGFGLDRQSRRDSQLAAFVPEPFRYFSQQIRVMDGIAGGNAQGQLAAARMLVSRRPIPEEGLAALGLAAYANGQADLAGQAIALASSRGWRDPSTQMLVAASALELGNMQVAADRASALWKTANLNEQVHVMTTSILADAKGRRHFAMRLAEYEPAVDAFVQWAPAAVPDASLEPALRDLVRSGARIDCAEISGQSERLLNTGAFAAAQALWNGACSAKGRHDAMRDVSFEIAEDKPLGPYAWRYPQAAGIETSLSRDKAGNVVLAYSNSGALQKAVASKVAKLAPGFYRPRWVSGAGTSETGMTPSAQNPILYLRLQCLGAKGPNAYMTMVALTGNDGLQIPENGCPMQRLELISSRGTGGGGRLSMQSITQ